MNYLEDIQRKRQQTKEQDAELLAERKEIVQKKRATDSVVTAIKAANESNQTHREKTTVKVKVTNPEVSVNNLPDLALKADIDRLVSAIAELKTALKPQSVEFSPVVTALESLGKKLNTTFEQNDSLKVTNLDEITNAINKLQLSPVFDPKIEVKPTPVKVQTEKTDIKPLLKAIESLKVEPEETIKLEDFVAQDLFNTDAFQYVALQDNKGRFCAIENDIEGNSMRFYFSNTYPKNFRKECTSYPYRLIAEAINAI